MVGFCRAAGESCVGEGGGRHAGVVIRRVHTSVCVQRALTVAVSTLALSGATCTIGRVSRGLVRWTLLPRTPPSRTRPWHWDSETDRHQWGAQHTRRARGGRAKRPAVIALSLPCPDSPLHAAQGAQPPMECVRHAPLHTKGRLVGRLVVRRWIRLRLEMEWGPARRGRGCTLTVHVHVGVCARGCVWGCRQGYDDPADVVAVCVRHAG